MDYIKVSNAAENWGISPRRVRILCAEGKIPGVIRKGKLYDYYGTGAHFCPAMYTMLTEIKNWSPEKIIEEASKCSLI